MDPWWDGAHTVVVGGGIAGVSAAYHLAKLGGERGGSVVLLEQGRLAGGTTWHAAGMVSRWRTSGAMARINQGSARLYAELEALSGRGGGWRQVGSLNLARTPERLAQFRRTTARARRLGIECHELGPAACGLRFPGIRTDDLAGGMWIPHDGRCDPEATTLAIAETARRAGARLEEGVEVTGLVLARGRIAGVATALGEIRCERVVLCGGMWTRHLALQAGACVPLIPVEHHYAVSASIPEAHGGLPCVRDMDGAIYFRGEDGRDGGAVVLGAFQEVSKPWEVERVPADFQRKLLPPDWDRFEAPAREGCIGCRPWAGAAGIGS